MTPEGISLNNIKWQLRQGNKECAEKLRAQFGLHPVIARVFAARGITSPAQAHEFLGRCGMILYDPWLLPDMDKAVARLLKAIKHREQICIYGDYDADGITATALLIKFFRWLGLKVGYYIPHRVEEGYGLNSNALKKIISKGYKLLLTVDTGATAIAEIKFAQSQGLDVIVTDHHQVGDSLPPALAVVDPAHPESRYPFSQLAGVGVAYKLISALCEALKIDASRGGEFLDEHLDLVALGTIADVVPLISENRTLVRAGLEKITRTTNIGLLQLISQASLARRKISTRQVAFYLAPRLNAAGRTAHASLAVDLLICDERRQAQMLAKQLNHQNDHRQRLEEEIFEQCLRQIETNIDLDNEIVIVTAQEGWHEGLVGLVASKITDILHRPTFVLNLEKEQARGSGRSCGEFSIFLALHRCKDILLSYGGHHFACGVKLLAQDLPKFRYMLNEYAQSHLDKITAHETLWIDTEVAAKELNLELMESIEEMEPFGEGNPSPVFLLKKVYLLEPPRVVGNNHLKLLISDKERTLSAIGFEMGSLINRLKGCYKRSPINLVFEPIRSNWGNQPTVEIKIKDIQV